MSRTRRSKPAPFVRNVTRPSHRTGPFFVSVHAIERFGQRIAPELSAELAKRELIELSRSSSRTGEHTPGGEELWLARGTWTVVFVVKADHYTGPVAVTVLALEDTLLGDIDLPLAAGG